MSNVTLFKTEDQSSNLFQTKLKSVLDPILSNPILAGHQINTISLPAASPVTINHKLSRKMQGWFLVDINQDANVWRTIPLNDKTLTLISDADCRVSIWVF